MATAKIIRFDPNRPAKPMDVLTVDDLKREGFVALRFISTKGPNGRSAIQLHPKKMVHKSVPEYSSEQIIGVPQFPEQHPIVDYELGTGWVAQWGAIRFYLRGEMDLWRFMKFFEYPLSIDQK